MADTGDVHELPCGCVVRGFLDQDTLSECLYHLGRDLSYGEHAIIVDLKDPLLWD